MEDHRIGMLELQQIVERGTCCDDIFKAIASFVEDVSSSSLSSSSQADTTASSHQTFISSYSSSSASLVVPVSIELDKIGWKNVKLSTSFSHFQLLCQDANGTIHTCTVKLLPSYPSSPPQCSVSLPVPFEMKWSNESKLHGVYIQFCAAVSSCELFWRDVQEIYERVRVLDPASFDSRSTQLRLAMHDSVSLHLSLNPSLARQRPHIQFMGPDQQVDALMDTFTRYEWDSTKSLLNNLMAACGSSLIVTSESLIQQSDGDNLLCGVCYSYKLEGHIPSEMCKNRPCSRCFHLSCLVEWLRCLPDSKQSFSTLFGSCPYCESPMSVQIMSSK
eukprot:m.44643 g.44643  ORF g.44643 m.44643 type:complete len:332 (-) comp10615_c0_seq1:2639-3634(-)